MDTCPSPEYVHPRMYKDACADGSTYVYVYVRTYASLHHTQSLMLRPSTPAYAHTHTHTRTHTHTHTRTHTRKHATTRTLIITSLITSGWQDTHRRPVQRLFTVMAVDTRALLKHLQQSLSLSTTTTTRQQQQHPDVSSCDCGSNGNGCHSCSCCSSSSGRPPFNANRANCVESADPKTSSSSSSSATANASAGLSSLRESIAYLTLRDVVSEGVRE
eukprot:GHVU01053546.1.p1 GENE.GHVU01053546.1~~GHVU01053546.1.p1  ORF type:complete len:217 (-),score=28.97 GHVU01053546.1:106-756(-)